MAALRIIETNRPDTIGFELDGRLTAAEIDAFAGKVNAMLEEGRPKRIVGLIRKYDGFEMSGLLDWDYAAMEVGLLRSLERYAVVGGPDWVRFWVRLLDPLFRIDLRHFAPEDEAKAWAFVEAEPAGPPRAP